MSEASSFNDAYIPASQGFGRIDGGRPDCLHGVMPYLTMTALVFLQKNAFAF
jgi:hypothetical protein